VNKRGESFRTETCGSPETMVSNYLSIYVFKRLGETCSPNHSFPDAYLSNGKLVGACERWNRLRHPDFYVAVNAL
jgi:hypothetical protein